jgi:hypothetical protein
VAVMNTACSQIDGLGTSSMQATTTVEVATRYGVV